MDKKLTLADVRKVLADSVDFVFGYTLPPLEEISDEELLNLNFKEDLGLDSLDMIVVTLSLQRNCNVIITDDVIVSTKDKGNTVRVMLDECNQCILTR